MAQQSQQNKVLNSRLQGVLSCLDVQLEAELIRYRRQKAKARSQTMKGKDSPLAALDLSSFSPAPRHQSGFAWKVSAPVNPLAQHPEMDPRILSIPLPSPSGEPVDRPRFEQTPSPSEQSLQDFEEIDDIVDVTRAALDRYSALLDQSQIEADMAAFAKPSAAEHTGAGNSGAGNFGAGNYVILTDTYTPQPVIWSETLRSEDEWSKDEWPEDEWSKDEWSKDERSKDESTVLEVNDPIEETILEAVDIDSTQDPLDSLASLDLPPELSEADLWALGASLAIVEPRTITWRDDEVLNEIPDYEVSDEDDLWPDELDEEPWVLVDPLNTAQQGEGTALAALEITALDSTALDSTALDSTALDSTALDSTALDSTALDTPTLAISGIDISGIDISGIDTTAIEAPPHLEKSGTDFDLDVPLTEDLTPSFEPALASAHSSPSAPSSPSNSGSHLVPVGHHVTHTLKPLGQPSKALSPLTETGYLASSEALLDSLEEEEGSQNWTKKLSNLFTPQGIGSALLLIFSALAVSMVLLNPELVSHWKLGRFAGSPPEAIEEGGSDGVIEENPPVETDQNPYNPNAQEFLNLDLGNLSKVKPQSSAPNRTLSDPTLNPSLNSTLNPTLSPANPEVSAASSSVGNEVGNEAEMFSNLRDSLGETGSGETDNTDDSVEIVPAPQAVRPTPPASTAAPAASQRSSTPPPQQPTIFEPETPPAVAPSEASSGETYVVVTPYTSDRLLDQSQAIVPNAYLKNTDQGANIQFGVFNDPDAAAAFAAQLQEEGIPVEVVPAD